MNKKYNRKKYKINLKGGNNYVIDFEIKVIHIYWLVLSIICKQTSKIFISQIIIFIFILTYIASLKVNKQS